MTSCASVPAAAPPRDGGISASGAEDNEGSKYSSRLSRAREANNFARRTNGGALSNSEGISPMMLRSPSQAEHDIRNRLSGTSLGNGPPPQHVKTGGTSPLKSAVWGVVATQRINASAATRMEAEVDRNEFGDCREMVRDITSATLPTRSELAARAERERGGEHVSLSWRGAAKDRGAGLDAVELDGNITAEEAAEGNEETSLSWKSAASTRTGSADQSPSVGPKWHAPISSRLAVHEPAKTSSEEEESTQSEEAGSGDEEYEELRHMKQGAPVGPAGRQLRVGAAVKVTGLSSERAAALNGRSARVIGYDAAKERFQVKMLDDGQQVNLRRPNLLSKEDKLAGLQNPALALPAPEEAAAHLNSSAPSINAWVAISSAFAAGSDAGVKSALQMRADPNVALSTGELPLAAAAARGMGSLVVTLLASGVQIDKGDLEGDTALHAAARAGRADMCEMLLGGGARLVRNVAGRTPVDVAAGEAATLLQRTGRASVMSSEDCGEEESGMGSIAPRPAGLPMSDAIRAMFGRGEPVEVAASSASKSTCGPPLPPAPPPPQFKASTIPECVAGDPSTRLFDPGQLKQAIGQTLKHHPAEFTLKHMLLMPAMHSRRVSCDVVRVGGLGKYRCYLRLGDDPSQRVCIFEAHRSRKGKLSNSHYYISLPDDPRFFDAAGSVGKADEKRKSLFRLPIRSSRGDGGDGPSAGSDDPVGPGFCGKVRSFGLSGSAFLVYDDGHKPGKEWTTHQPHVRQQMAAAVFQRGNSRRAPMTMRAMLPTQAGLLQQAHQTELAKSTQGDILKVLENKSVEDIRPPEGMEVLNLAPPEWSDDAQVYQLAYEGRAVCMSNKNVQLVPRDRPVAQPMLQVGKLQKDLFNVDFSGFFSVYQAFALSLAVFDQSSVRRRF
mmetsp:Transcript_17805/g.58160  ORF Transcript_17805/g.58160 Transcript_17805/m.58160 type:complete len:897 (-) Transcript_17805:288-2978(-)